MSLDRTTSIISLERARTSLYHCRGLSHRRSCSLSFERLLELYDDRSLNNKQRAACAGVSAGTLTRLYDRHFRVLYGNRSLEQRRRESESPPHVRKRHDHFWTEFLRLAWARQVHVQATKAGHIVQPAIAHYGSGGSVQHYLRKQFVLISGHLCRVFYSRPSQVVHGTLWARVDVHSVLKGDPKIEACIAIVSADEESQMFVIPREDTYLLLANRQASKPILNIPFRTISRAVKAVGGIRESKLDFERYNQGWHLIPAPPLFLMASIQR